MAILLCFMAFFIKNIALFTSYNLTVYDAKSQRIALAAPTNVAASDNELDCIRVSWTASPQAKGYRVFKAKNAKTTGSLLKTPTVYPQNGQPLWIVDYGVKAGIVYYYYVCAVDAKGKLSERSASDAGVCLATANGNK